MLSTDTMEQPHQIDAQVIESLSEQPSTCPTASADNQCVIAHATIAAQEHGYGAMEVIEDVIPRTRQSESISTVSSDPLDFRQRYGVASSCASSAYSESDFGSDEDNYDEEGGYATDASAAASCEGKATKKKKPQFHAIEEVDVTEMKAPFLEEPCPIKLAADGENNGEDASAVEVPTTTNDLPVDDDVLEKIPLVAVSEAPVATIDNVIVSGSTVVATKSESSLILDVGTRMCLADGTLVGCIATLFGPVASCSYALICKPAAFAALLMDSKISEGIALHYDLLHQTVLFEPEAHCEGGRGTDASFFKDEELPHHVRPDFSDDDAERDWKKKKREAKVEVVVAASSGAQERISSDESEAEFDEEGNTVMYRPKKKGPRLESHDNKCATNAAGARRKGYLAPNIR